MKVLFVESSPSDVEAIVAELRRFGFDFEHQRVESIEALRAALDRNGWSAIIAGPLDALELSSQKELFDEAQRMAHIGSFEYDLLTGRRIWSAELCNIWGLDVAEEPDPRAIDEHIHPDDYERVLENRRAILQLQQPYAGDHRIVLPGGEVRTIHERGRFIFDEGGRAVKIVGVVQDVTETRAQEQQLVFHAAQQSAIAELSRIALTSAENAIPRACSVIKDVLEIDLSMFLEADERDRILRCTAGAPTILPLSIPMSESWADDTLARRTSIVIDDYTADRSIHAPLVDLGMTSGVMVPVASSTRRFGILTAHTERKRRFSSADVDLLQSLANILADALERELGRRALFESEQRYREVVEGASEIIFTSSIDGLFTSLNAAFENETGWSREAWLGHPMREMLIPEDVPLANELFRTVVTRQRSQSAELTIKSPRGMLLINVTAFPKVENEYTVAVYGFARDVTEQRLVERERLQLTRNLQLLLESTVEGIITVDLEGRCTMSNRAAAQILGLPEGDIAGSDLRILLGPFNVRPIFDVARSGEICVGTDTFWNSAGTAFPVEYSAAPVIDQGRAVGIVISFTDITARRKLEAKLEQADRLSSLGRLAATIAHEFNNILMGISPFIEIMRRGRNIEAALDHVARAVKRGKRLTEDILRFTQPAEPVRAAIDTASWLDHIMMEARSVLPRHISLEWNVEPPDLLILGDAAQLQQIFTNLMLNARDAMPRGGLVSITARRGAPGERVPAGMVDRPDRFAHFTVRDDGQGMSSDTLRHIFEPLFTTKKTGTGLGLAVAHQVVKRHDGEIFVESVLGEGTTFHIFLPLAEENELLVREPEPARPAALHPRKILIVEDDDSVASGLVSLLEIEGMEVEVASTGRAAIRAIETSDADVVLLDVGLPDMDGTVVYTEIAARRPDLPIIFSTGHGDRTKLQEILDQPRIAYLLKPYDGAALLEAIRAVV